MGYKEHLYALIVAGGGGTRLWPRSRNASPKQFIKLFHKQTLTQITAHRFNKILPWEKIFVVTVSEDYKKEILVEVPQILPKNVIVEPLRKNTAPAHGLGAAYIIRKDPQAIILNETADHLVEPEEAYFKVLFSAAEAASLGDWLITVGVKPTYPNIGYGHIKKGKEWKVVGGKKIYRVDKFVEKPPLPLAKKYTASGNYFWNACEYVWKADNYLKALKIHEPKVGEAIERISKAIGTRNEYPAIKSEYEKMPDVTSEGKPLSIDYAVSEKADNMLLVTTDYHWTDIGDWNEVWQNLPKDINGNVFIDGDEPGGRIINIDTSNAIVQTDGRLIAIIDVDDVAVVDTKDILLVCAKSRAQNVKKIVEQLKEEKVKELL